MNVKILQKMLLKLVSPKGKCTNLVILVCIGFLGFYICTSYSSSNSDKISPSVEIYNDTGYTETPMIVNTETTNVMIRKQQTNHFFERPVLTNETVTALHSIQIGELFPNCGLKKICGNNEFAVHLYTGKDHADEPRLCVDGKYILSRSVNGGGRGMNVAVIDSLTRSIIRVSHFDTYEKESTLLETLLLTLRPGDIIIILTFDEPSRRLSRIARLLLYDLGSGLIQNLNYRDSWYFITQKGLKGFAPFEELHAVESNGWPLKHDVKLCVPFELKGKVAHPDPLTSTNPSRVEFCEKHEDLPLFCDADVVNDLLVPSPVWKQPAAINRIYNVPILVMSGSNVEFLPLTLETLVRQPGMKPNLVVVYHLPEYTMVQNLADLFGFMTEELSPTSNYCEQVAEAMEIASMLFVDAKEIILIGENVILAPDFLFYMGQLLSILNTDSSILSVSALNENGFRSLSGDPSLTYRVESFSGLAVLVRRDFFQRSWCGNESTIDPFFISSNISGISLSPDVSRITLAASHVSSLSTEYLSHDRTVTYEQNILLKNTEKLIQEEYDQEFENLMLSAVTMEFDIDSLKHCINDKEYFRKKILEEFHVFVTNTTGLSSRTLAIFYHQRSKRDTYTLEHLCDCIGLLCQPHHPVRGLYKGILRFLLKENPAVLVGSESFFFRFKPKRSPVLKYDEQLGHLISVLL